MKKIVLCGHEKTGTTWALFVVCNYFNILNFDAKECLPWGEVLRIVGGYKQRAIELTDKEYKFNKGVAHVYYTHTSIYNSPKTKIFFNQFDNIIYICRNPFDTMISLYHYKIIKGIPKILNNIKKVGGLRKYIPFDNFIRKGDSVDEYINHIKYNKHKADLVLDYDKLRKDPSNFRKLIGFLTDKIDEKLFKKALKLSSFDNIRRIEIEQKKVNLKARNGRTGQYKEQMNKKQIDFIKNKWLKASLHE